MSGYVVELKNVTKRFPGVIALKSMSIQIRPGEIHGLIGENGAGKSTLIKVLTGVHIPEEGEIFVSGSRDLAFTNGPGYGKIKLVAKYMCHHRPLSSPSTPTAYLASGNR